MKTTLKLVLFYLLYQFLFGAMMTGLSFIWPISVSTQLGWSLILPAVVMPIHLVLGGYIHLRQALRPVKFDVMLSGVVCIVGAIMCCNALSGLIVLPDWLANDFTSLSYNPVGIAGLVIFGPWVEELLFRGAILPAFDRGDENPWRGILLSALAFGLIHINPAQVFFGFLMGIALGWVTMQSRSLLPAIVGHVINNGLSVMELRVSASNMTEVGIQSYSTGALLFLTILGLGVTLIAGRQLEKELA